MIARRLADADRANLMEFLDSDPLINIQLRERVSEGRLDDLPSIAVERDGELMVVATMTPSVHAAVAGSMTADDYAEAGSIVARELLRRSVSLRALIAPARIVDPLWESLEGRVPTPPVDRRRQPVYVLDASPPVVSSDVRLGTTDDLAELVPACAAMYLEEVGIDPLARDPKWYAQRIREIVLNERSFVIWRDGRVAFKCEVAAETEDAVQLMGVWTRPDLRRQGLARLGLTEVIARIGSTGKAVTLFVNDFNVAAIRLYESLGFRQIGVNRALIW